MIRLVTRIGDNNDGDGFENNYDVAADESDQIHYRSPKSIMDTLRIKFYDR